jgi:hypothetical protein
MATGNAVLGHHQAENGDIRAVTADVVTDTAVPLSPGNGTAVEVRPAIALLLADPLAPGSGPGVATRAIGAAFVAAHLTGADHDRFVLADCAIGLPLAGPIALWSGAGAEQTCLPAEFGDLIGRLIALADTRGGLAAGELAVFGRQSPSAGLRTAAGTVAVWGPGGSALLVTLQPTEPALGSQR